MKCKQIQTQLADYSALRLAPSDAETVRRHLDSCHGCSLFLREEASLAQGLERMAAVEPGTDLWTKVALNLDAPEIQAERARRSRWSLPLGRRSLAAVMASLTATAALAGYTYFNNVDTSPANPRTTIAKDLPSIPAPSRDVNPEVDDPMADRMTHLMAAVDHMTGDETQ